MSFWQYAVTCATWVKNRIAHGSNADKITPYQLFWSKKPDLSLLKVFGSPCYAHINNDLHKKLEPRATPAVFVGYDDQFKAWLMWDPKTKKDFVARSAIFNERISDDKPTLQWLKVHDFHELTAEQLEEAMESIVLTEETVTANENATKANPP